MARGCAQWVVTLAVGSVQLWWKAGYLKKGGEATAPEALKGGFIPKGSVVRGPLLQLPLLPLGCEYCSVSQPGAPHPQPGHAASQRLCV